MPKLKSRMFERLLYKWPGRKKLGVYRFMPFFFFFGAGLEFVMINLKVGEANFYTVFKRRQAINKIEDDLRLSSQNKTLRVTRD